MITLRSFAIVSLITLSGCASQPGGDLPAQSTNAGVELDDLYIRGVFNWWEAKAKYKINESRGQGAVDVELIADGQPYDFKFSDQHWSPSQTCGGSYAGQLASTSSSIYLTCGSNAQNIQFTPSEDGTYRFIVNSAGSDEFKLSVVQVK